MELFDHFAGREAEVSAPLAERMRPRRLAEFIGQRRAVGEGSLLRLAIERDRIFSMILWGPPGCGKTTLARLIAAETRAHFIHFSAVLSGVKDIRAVIEEAREERRIRRRRTVLFVDEIHRFNKSQQDAFLPHVESGLITLIGATTENPSFEVIAPLLSRCRVVTLERLGEGDLAAIAAQALADEERGLGKLRLQLAPEARQVLVRAADGDARVLLNTLEIAAAMVPPAAGPEPAVIPREVLERALEKKVLLYDRQGEEHYNLISALHKSLRGSDPDAALYWLARMLAAGEDPLYIARRLVRFASEDVGNADPQALALALAAMEAFRFLGPPEGELALAQAAVYLAAAPKSNRVYLAWGLAREAAENSGSLPVPLHLRNAPTGLMRELGYGRGYRYAHDSPEGYLPQEHLPEELQGRVFYRPSPHGMEREIAARLQRWRRLGAPTASPPAGDGRVDPQGKP